MPWPVRREIARVLAVLGGQGGDWRYSSGLPAADAGPPAGRRVRIRLWRCWARMGAPPRRARRGASVSCCDVAGIPGPRSRFAVNAAVRSGVRTGQLCQSLGYTPGPGQGSDRRVSATPRGHRPSRRSRVHFCPALWRSRRSRRAPQICAVQQPARDPDSGIARRDHVDRVARTAGDRAQARATRGHHIRRLAPRRRFRCPTIGREGHRRR